MDEKEQKKDVQNIEKQESEKQEQPAKSESKEEKTEKTVSKSKGKKNTKVIIAIVLIIAILLAAGFGVYYYFENQEDINEEDNLEWGDVYLEILEDEDKKLEDLSQRKIQLLDLDKDSIPELIVYGIRNATKYIANIYKINDKKQVDTVQVELDNEFDIKLLYNAEKEDYGWYAVPENSTDDQGQKTVYDLNIETKKYEPEKLEVNPDLDIVEVEDNYSKKVDFDQSLSKKEIKETLEEAKKEYVETEDMITDEVEAKVEELKVYKNVKRIDKSKGLVYTAYKFEDQYGDKYEYPAININSPDVEKINAEIKENYGFSKEDEEWLIGWELVEISYSYNIKDKYLSLLVKEGGNQSIWASGYVINLEDCKKLTSEQLLEKEGLDKTEVIKKVKEVALSDYNSQIEKEKKSMGNDGWTQLGYDKSEAEWKSNLEKDVDELKDIYFNEDGDLCVITEYRHPGGQWSCTKSLIINISKNYSVKELILNNGGKSSPEFETDTQKETTTSTPEPSTSSSSSNSDEILPVKTTMSNITFTNNPTITVGEGVYKRNSGTLTITNSKKGSFDFKIECSWMTASGYPNLGELSGTAKQTSDGNFAYVEKKSEGAYSDYNVIFYLADGGVKIQDEEESGFSPYCGHNVVFGGLYLQ